MKIQILSSAVKDLEEGRMFYEKQGKYHQKTLIVERDLSSRWD